MPTINISQKVKARLDSAMLEGLEELKTKYKLNEAVEKNKAVRIAERFIQKYKNEFTYSKYINKLLLSKQK